MVMSGIDGRRAPEEAGIPGHSRNGCSRLSSNSAHTLLEAFREPLDSMWNQTSKNHNFKNLSIQMNKTKTQSCKGTEQGPYRQDILFLSSF